MENESRTIAHWSRMGTARDLFEERPRPPLGILPPRARANLFVDACCARYSSGWRSRAHPRAVLYLARAVTGHHRDFPWARDSPARIIVRRRGRTPPREIFPGDAIVAIAVPNDFAIDAAPSRRETRILYSSTRKPARGSCRVTLTIMRARGAVSLFRGEECR